MDGPIKMFNPRMEYRIFGQTNIPLSVITLGGMRFNIDKELSEEENLENMVKQASQVVSLAFERGINHIETAFAYQYSETCFGRVLNDVLKVPRSRYYLMTKGRPKNREEVRPLVEKQLNALKTSYFDLYAYHGINEEESLGWAIEEGVVDELQKLKAEGVIRHIGFSTHGNLDIILKTLETNAFEFVNLHYYYFNQRLKPAVDLATQKNMGVFIISPNDKGGQLFKAPKKVRDATAPFTPIQWNARFCLLNPHVHTLSFGMTEKSHFEEMVGIFTPRENRDALVKATQKRLDSFVPKPYCDFDPFTLDDDPSGMAVGIYYSLWKMWKFYDMDDFAKYRYNMFSPENSFLRGYPATEDRLVLMDDRKVPKGIDLKAVLRELHETFYGKSKPQFISTLNKPVEKLDRT